MGLNDAREQLEACKADAVRYEAQIEDLEAKLDGAISLNGKHLDALEERDRRVEMLSLERRSLLARCDVLEAQIAELEHENLRLGAALRDALRHETHRAAAAAAGDSLLVPGPAAEEGAAAVRMLAAIVRNLPAIPPDRLDAVADLLTPPPPEENAA